jgi:preprotein translocase subunit SecA
LEDELVARHSSTLSAWIRRRPGRGERQIRSGLAGWVFDRAQSKAERLALRQRKSVLQTDDWLDQYLGFAGVER